MANTAAARSHGGKGTVSKARRVTRACDYCHRRSIRCFKPTISSEAKCQNCLDFRQPCTFNRQIKRRGAKPQQQSRSTRSPRSAPQTHNVNGNSHASSSQLGLSFRDLGGAQTPAWPPSDNHLHSVSTASSAASHVVNGIHGDSELWKAPQIATQAVIMDLVEIYFDIVYPIFPLFHRPSFMRKISRAEYNTNQGLFAVTMALCALVSARITDGAVYDARRDLGDVRQVAPEHFYNVAVIECRKLGFRTDLNTMKSYAILAIAAIQNGKICEMEQFLGIYHALVAMDGLHDEAKWPKDIGIIELEERRRLFWSIYTLDIYTSIVWSGVIRCREAQINVAYATEMDDDFFDDSGYLEEGSPPTSVSLSPQLDFREVFPQSNRSWLRGWNFTTDLYRILEHVIAQFRDRRLHKRSFLTEIFGNSAAVPAASVLAHVMSMYSQLPQRFKETPAITYNQTRDRYGFQAANITATIQLLRMVLFAAGGATIEQRCEVASEVVDAFLRVPVAYLLAISSPLLHHLAGIGAILGSVFEEPLSERDYQRVRTVLLSLAELLDSLDQGLRSTSSAEQLRVQVRRIDEYMDLQRQQGSVNVHDGLPRLEHTHGMAPTESDLGYVTSHSSQQLDIDPQLQLPAELLDQWPWSLDFMQNLG